LKVEIRADDSVHIEGYVNVCERESRPVATPYGKVNEVIAEGTFQRAVDSADEVGLMVDHERLIGSTKTGLELSEDAIGLRAELDTSDEEVVEAAKAGKIKGWSFGFRKAVDSLEQRAEKLPLRRITELVLDEVSLIINKNPCYSATSVEVRADGDIDVEQRAYVETTVEVTDRTTTTAYDDGSVYTRKVHNENVVEETSGVIDYTEFDNRLAALRRV